MSINKPYRSIVEMPSTLAIFPLSGALLLPRGDLPLNIFEPRYMSMVDDSIASTRLIGMVQPSLNGSMDDEPTALEAVGCVGRITQLAETGDGRYVLNLTGVIRFQIRNELDVQTPYRQCVVDYDSFAEDLAPVVGDGQVDRPRLLKSLRQLMESRQLPLDWRSVERTSTETLVNALSMIGPFEPQEKQALLEARDIRARVEMLVALAEMDQAGEAPATLQ